jgi:HlyD family secretion protein
MRLRTRNVSTPHPASDGGGDPAPGHRAGGARRRVFVVTALLITGAGAWWLKGRGAGPSYVTVPVAEGPLVARVTANGTIAARVTVQVGSQVSGRIQEILVDFNSKVTRGQVLARLEPALFRAAVEQARANLAAALGGLAKSRAEARNASKVLQRSKVLVARDLIAGADLDRAEADADAGRGDVAAARGGVEQARAALRQAEVNMAYTTIVSPVDGVVISRNVDVGQTVAASLQAPTLFTIAQDLRTLQVHTNVPEADVGKVGAGMKASFTVDAFPEEKWNGVVSEVRNASQVSQNVVTYDAVVDIENRGARLRPGMTATVSFVYAERARASSIPNAALRYQPADRRASPTTGAADERGRAGQRAVYVLGDGAPVRRLIRPGISDGKSTEVVEGDLRPGEPVIIDERADDGKGDSRQDPRRRLPARL